MDRQKILLLFGIAWVSAALLTWFLYAKTRAPKSEKRIAILAAVRDLPNGALLKKSDLKQVLMAEKDVPKGAIFQEREALSRVLLYPVGANEPLTRPKLSAVTAVEGVSSTIEPGYRAVSVQITDVSGVAGLIQPGSRVDVLFTRTGSRTDAVTSTILQNVKVLAMGRTTQPGVAADPKAPRATVATLVVTPEETQKLELAKNHGKISLALRNPTDDANAAPANPITTDALDPTLQARLARSRRNLQDPQGWQGLAGAGKPEGTRPEQAARQKPPEKPRVVVDVYRGDKHVQEIFP